jgi:asparagine synthase (glutamine-hydrolysing)
VPVGLTLSGGLDSSAVMTSVNKNLVYGSTPVKAYTATFDKQPYSAEVSEQPWAKLAADRYSHINQQPILSSMDNWLQTLRQCIRHMDGPGYSPAVFPQWSIMIAASQDGVKVLLEGQGADELLGGYPDYAAANLLDRTWPLLRKFKWFLLWKELQTYFATFGLTYFLMRLVRLISARLKNFNYRYSGVIGVMRNDFIERAYLYPENLSTLQNRKSISLPEKLMRNDFMSNILPGLLQYGDSISMAHGVESRQPFLDHRLVEFCSRLPIEWKIRDGQTKFILREYLRRHGQVEIANRQDKKGYPTPLEYFFKQNNGELLREMLLSPEAKIHDYCDAPKIEKLINRYLAGLKRSVNPLYRLLSTELWLRECIFEMPG